MLDVLISFCLIYFLLSNLVSILFEWYSQKTKSRGKFLFNAVLSLLNDRLNKSYGVLVYSHPLVDALKKDNKTPPQYISSSVFADAFIDVIGRQSIKVTYQNIVTNDGIQVIPTEERNSNPFERFRLGVDSMKHSELKELLRMFYEKSNSSYDTLKLTIAVWYDDYMERVSGWYKVSTKKTIRIIAFMVCISLNVDSIRILNVLLRDDNNLRANLVSGAEQLVQSPGSYRAISDTNKTIETIKEVIKQSQSTKDSINRIYLARLDSSLDQIESYSLPIGWVSSYPPCSFFVNKSGDSACAKKPDDTTCVKKTCDTICITKTSDGRLLKSILLWIAGIFISTLTLSFGAPFWFDVLVNLINIRRAGAKPEKAVTTKADNS